MSNIMKRVKLEIGDKIIVRCPKRAKPFYFTAGKEYTGTVDFVCGFYGVRLEKDDGSGEAGCLLGHECAYIKGLNWQYVRKVKS